MPTFRRTMRGSRLTIAAVVVWLVVLAVAAPGPRAGVLSYVLEFPERESVAYSVALDVRHAGPISVRATGVGRRTILLRLEPPKGPAGHMQRSGPPPVSLATTVDPAAGELGEWKLQIRALAGAGPLRVTVQIDLPDPPVSSARATPAPSPASEKAKPVPTAVWTTELRRGAPTEHHAYLAAAERFAHAITVLDADAPGDGCRWQSDLSSYLESRAEALQRASYPSRPTREILDRIARAVEAVESLRRSTDPFVAGPPPDDPSLATAWVRARTERLAPLEQELDALLEALRRGYAPELAVSAWPSRLVTCLTACERFFDERLRLGERRATNRELAEAQWPRLVAAADALSALSVLGIPAQAHARP